MKNLSKIKEVRAAEAAYRASFDAMMEADRAWTAAEAAYSNAEEPSIEAEKLLSVAVEAEEKHDKLQRANTESLANLAKSIFDAMGLSSDSSAHYLFVDFADHFVKSKEVEYLFDYQQFNKDIEIPVFGKAFEDLCPDAIMTVSEDTPFDTCLRPVTLDLNIPVRDEWCEVVKNVNIVIWLSWDKERSKDFVDALGSLVKSASEKQK